MNMSNFTELYNTTLHTFSDTVIVWLYNEKLYKEINWPCAAYLCILAILGIFGNSLVIYIYGCKFGRTTAHFFILSLAVIDNMCCCAIVMEVLDKRFPMYSGNYVVLCKITRLIEVFSIVSSSMLLLCIAFDRYYKVCKPLKRKAFSYQKARKCLVMCVVIGILISWPIIFLKGPETVETGIPNVVGYDCGSDNHFRDSVIPTIYYGSMGILNVLAILLLAAMYIQIFRAIRNWKRKTIGESIKSQSSVMSRSHISVISSSHKDNSKMVSWLKKSKDNLSKSISDSSSLEASNRSLSLSDQYSPSSEDSTFQNNGNFELNGVYRTSQSSSVLSSSCDSGYRRKESTISVDSVFSHNNKRSKKVTTNTILFSIVTVIYIIAYSPTMIVEILYASGLYTEAELSNTLRRMLVFLNTTYFINNVCNQYVYSSIDPEFRKKVKEIFVGP